MLRLEKQLARYVLMSDTIKEEFEQDEAVKAAKLGLEYDQTQAEFKEKQDQLMAKLEEAYQQFVQQGKNSAEQALSDLTQRRKGELSRLDSEAEAEMAQIMMGTEKYEDACRTRYSVEVERQNERLNKARSEAMLGESEQLEDVSNQQQERAQMLGSVRSEAQALANSLTLTLTRTVHPPFQPQPRYRVSTSVRSVAIDTALPYVSR